MTHLPTRRSRSMLDSCPKTHILNLINGEKKAVNALVAVSRLSLDPNKETESCISVVRTSQVAADSTGAVTCLIIISHT